MNLLFLFAQLLSESRIREKKAGHDEEEKRFAKLGLKNG